jgi:hypothetical protein
MRVSTLEVFGMQAHSIIDELETEIFPPVNPTPSDSILTIMYQSRTTISSGVAIQPYE